jgi:hypothetical protein
LNTWSSGTGSSFARSLKIPKRKQSEDQQAFGDDAMGATQIKEWFNRFKDGLTLADSDQCSGRPSTSQNANVFENVRSDPEGPSFDHLRNW